MPDLNPYDILRIPRNADLTAIEDAYDRLFDEYEPAAENGHEDALEMLGRLNEARDILIDPEQRAALDRQLGQGTFGALAASTPIADPVSPGKAASTKTAKPHPRAGKNQTPAANTSTLQNPSAQKAPEIQNQQTIKMRRRSYEGYMAEPPRRAFSLTPYILVSALVLAVAGVSVFLLARGPQCTPPPEPPNGQIVATVNGVPIYNREYEEQATTDTQRALNDPMVMALIGSFDTITGTRFIDGMKYDALDKRINMEILQQEARKEGIYPTEEQIAGLLREARAAEVPPGETFECFLQRIGVSEAQYNRKVIENVVFVAMANRHMPQQGNAEERAQGFINWICTTRRNYDAQHKLTFIVKENRPCTSGLPSDVPLPGVDTTPVPEVPIPEDTVAPTAAPGGGGTPQATAPPNPNEPSPVPTEAETLSTR